jgi:hypothetical protein
MANKISNPVDQSCQRSVIAATCKVGEQTADIMPRDLSLKSLSKNSGNDRKRMLGPVVLVRIMSLIFPQMTLTRHGGYDTGPVELISPDL